MEITLQETARLVCVQGSRTKLMVLSRSRVQMSMVHLGMHHLLDFFRKGEREGSITSLAGHGSGEKSTADTGEL